MAGNDSRVAPWEYEITLRAAQSMSWSDWRSRSSIDQLSFRENCSSAAVLPSVLKSTAIEQVNLSPKHVFELVLHVNAIKQTPMSFWQVFGDEVHIAVRTEIVAQYRAEYFECCNAPTSAEIRDFFRRQFDPRCRHALFGCKTRLEQPSMLQPF
jgi:hypothetical protein